jgi:inner membrane protease subunit 2
MLHRLAIRSPIWATLTHHASWLYVSAGVYFLGLQFHEEVATLLVVEGASMRPTLNPEGSSNNGYESSDICLLQKWRYIPNRGDVVCMYAPRKPGAVVKRIVGVTGDIITPRDSSFNKGAPIPVPIGHVWVEGDNANNSIDSNQYGFVPIGMLIGRVSHVVYRQDESSSSQFMTKINSFVPEPERVQPVPITLQSFLERANTANASL